MKILGLKMTSHDTGAALIADGKIVAIGEERLNRIKYSENIFPEKAIEYCLTALGIEADAIEYVITDWIGTEVDPNATGWRELFDKKTGDRFKNAKVHCINHHDAHAATAFFCSPFEESAIMIYDGNGATRTNRLGVSVVETETLYRGRGSTITEISKTTHPRLGKQFPYTWGMGKLYAFLSHFYIGLGSHNEGKMMGLAAYGDDRILRTFPLGQWVAWHQGHLVCNSDITYPGTPRSLSIIPESFYRSLRSSPALRRFSIRLKSLLQSDFRSMFASAPIFEPITLIRPSRNKRTDTLPDEYYSSIAYAAQRIFEYFAISLAKHLRAITGSQNLCVAGGCGLNIDANRKFLTDAGFSRLFVQPASSDSGIALGCALWGWHIIAQQPRFWEMKNASLGRPYTHNEVDAALAERATELVWHRSPEVATETAKRIADGQIIGWFQGGSEYGPRALGYRSILCDPCGPKMKESLNVRVKHRENWRPFAASVLREKMSQWFSLDVDSPFMLLMASVHEDKRARIPAVTHVDGTCRLQTLTKEDNDLYYDLVHEFDRLTGVPLLLNTSFNLAGEPIVETPKDAVATFLSTDIDCLVLGDRIVTKKK